MSSVVSSAAANPTGGAGCATANLTIPAFDTTCAVGSTQGIPSNTSDVMSNCCGDAPVQDFEAGPDCGTYCLAYEQSIADLTKCLQDGGVDPRQIFCNDGNNATATGEPEDAPSETGGSGDGDDEDDEEGGAQALGVSKAGLSMLAMVFVSAAFGTLL